MKKKGYRRDQRVGDLLQTELAKIIQRETASLLEGLMVTVTGVDVSHDLSSAKVYVSVLQEDMASEAVAILNNATKTIRHLLAGAVRLRIVPELRFIFDDSIVRGNRIASIVRDVPSE